MRSQEQIQHSEERKRALAQLRADYKRLWALTFRKAHQDKEPGLQDLLAQLDRWHDVAMNDAKAELDKPGRSMALLQSAMAYDIVRTYIRRQLQ